MIKIAFTVLALTMFGLSSKGAIAQFSAVSAGRQEAERSVLGGPMYAVVSAGRQHSCGLWNGKAHCWGGNWAGQLGNATQIQQYYSVNVLGMDDGPLDISAGGANSCAVKSSGAAYCWGYNDGDGQLGNGSSTGAHAPGQPVAVGGGELFVTTTTGYLHACGLTVSGKVACWGSNTDGQLGDGSNEPRATATIVALETTATSVSAGSLHTCAVLSSGKIACWGDNSHGQLGIGSHIDANQPHYLASNAFGASAMAVSVAAGGAHTCALLDTGKIKCWGANGSGQLGYGDTGDYSAPASIANIPVAATRVTAGRLHTCALTLEYSVYCWGNNLFGQLGDGTTTDRKEPKPIVLNGFDGFNAVSAGAEHTCGRASDGAIACWGSNLSGQIGIGPGILYSTVPLIPNEDSILTATFDPYSLPPEGDSTEGSPDQAPSIWSVQSGQP